MKNFNLSATVSIETLTSNKRWLTPNEFQTCSGYEKGYIYFLTRSGTIKAIKKNHRLFIDFDAALSYLNLMQKNLKTGENKSKSNYSINAIVKNMLPKDLGNARQSVA